MRTKHGFSLSFASVSYFYTVYPNPCVLLIQTKMDLTPQSQLMTGEAGLACLFQKLLWAKFVCDKKLCQENSKHNSSLPLPSQDDSFILCGIQEAYSQARPTISWEEEDELGKKALLWVGEDGTRGQEIGQELMSDLMMGPQALRVIFKWRNAQRGDWWGEGQAWGGGGGERRKNK